MDPPFRRLGQTHVAPMRARPEAGNPLRVQRAIVSRIASFASRIYSGVQRALDRALCRVALPLADLLGLSKPLSGEAAEHMLCIYRHAGAGLRDNSIERQSLEDTLRRYAGEGSRVAVFYWDDGRPVAGFGIEFYLKVRRLNPRNLILSSYSPETYFQPAEWVIRRLRATRSAGRLKLIALWWDTCSDGFAARIESLVDLFDVHGIVENPTLQFGQSAAAECLKAKAIPLFTPYDRPVPGHEKDLDVAFMGQISDYRSARRRYLGVLLDQGLRVYYSAVEQAHQPGYDKYFEVLARSKIGVNFSMSVDRHQLKARVFETMLSGALLLEERNDQTARYFEDGVDYVSFGSEQELVDKIRYYLKNDERRAAIAESGRRKLREKFSGRQFWSRVL